MDKDKKPLEEATGNEEPSSRGRGMNQDPWLMRLVQAGNEIWTIIENTIERARADEDANASTCDLPEMPNFRFPTCPATVIAAAKKMGNDDKTPEDATGVTPRDEDVAFMLWWNENWRKFQDKNPGISMSELVKLGRKAWDRMEDKSEWMKAAEDMRTKGNASKAPGTPAPSNPLPRIPLIPLPKLPEPPESPTSGKDRTVSKRKKKVAPSRRTKKRPAAKRRRSTRKTTAASKPSSKSKKPAQRRGTSKKASAQRTKTQKKSKASSQRRSSSVRTQRKRKAAPSRSSTKTRSSTSTVGKKRPKKGNPPERRTKANRKPATNVR